MYMFNRMLRPSKGPRRYKSKVSYLRGRYGGKWVYNRSLDKWTCNDGREVWKESTCTLDCLVEESCGCPTLYKLVHPDDRPSVFVMMPTTFLTFLP